MELGGTAPRPLQPPLEWVATHPPRPPITYPIHDDGPSWRERCDAAMADDSGTVDADDW
jgi:hypothetical protein